MGLGGGCKDYQLFLFLKILKEILYYEIRRDNIKDFEELFHYQSKLIV